MENYTINEVAMMTGLTTRTLRNYIKLGILNGEKQDGIWKFSAQEVTDFIANPVVKPSIQAKNKALIYDFLAQDNKKVNEICTILDLYVEKEESEEICNFFCQKMCGYENTKIHFNYERTGKNTRIILSGYEDVVMELLNAYYER